MTTLPWFPFHIKAYLSDTLRLSTEAHGAYLLLILDYYESDEPPPDDDFILAAITKLPIEQWQKHRRVIEKFFQIKDGRWHHERIEREKQEAVLKHSASIARAQAGGHARARQMSEERATASETVAPRQRKRRNTAKAIPAAQPEAQPEQNREVAHLHKHPSITEGGGEPPAPEVDEFEDDEGIGTPISRNFTPDPATSDRAKAAGMSVDEIDAEVRKFIAKKLDEGAFSHDWQGSFAFWIERELKYRAKNPQKAPPRIEVNNERPEPTTAEWNDGCSWFKRGLPWPRHLGPDPDSMACRAPIEILQKHGLRKAKAS